MKRNICEVRIETTFEDKVTKILDSAKVRYKEMTRWAIEDAKDDEPKFVLHIRFEMNEKNFYKIRKKLSRYCASITVGNPQ